MATTAAKQHRRLQKQVARADHKRPKQKAQSAMQAGARQYPAPPFPKQHIRKPAKETVLKPAPLYDAPFWRGSSKLKGMTAIVTGGDSGIGRSVAVLFAREGADVAVIYLDEHEDARITKQAVQREGQRCLLFAGDVSKRKFCFDTVGKVIKAFGRLDVLVNNAAFQLHISHFEDLRSL
jgi:hypothetical protein